MSVIFEDVDNIQNLQFNFTQAIRIDRSLYYIQNSLLRKINLVENQFHEVDSIIVQAEVLQICSDGRLIYSLLQNGDIYQIEQPPRLLTSGCNYKWISTTTAIDHSHRGYFWKTHKQIYSHCKHISSCADRVTIITIGGKIFNYIRDQPIPIPQLNGLKLNTYFKKSLLFQFGGIATTEGGDLYLFNQKMIRIKIKDIQDIFATQKYIFALQGNNTILQYSIDDIKGHQFFTNQAIFQKMHYCNDLEFNCKMKQFQSIEILQAEYSMFCLAFIKDYKVLDTSLNATANNKSCVSMLKMSLFEDWDGRQKKKLLDARRSTTTDKPDKDKEVQLPEETTQTEDTLTLAQKLATIRESLTFEKWNAKLNNNVSTPQKIELIRMKESIVHKIPERDRQKSAIQLHKMTEEDIGNIIQSPPPVKLDNLLNKIHVNKPQKTIDELLYIQRKQDLQDSLPTFQNDEQFTQNDTLRKQMKNNKNTKKQQESMSSGIDVQSNSGFISQQHDSFIEILEVDKKTMDYPLQLQPFDRKKNQCQKQQLETIYSNESKVKSNRFELVLQPSNRSPRKSQIDNLKTDRSSAKRSIDQAKQDLETLVSIITKQKENTQSSKIQEKKPIRILSPACGQLRPESKITPLKNRRASVEQSSQGTIRMPARIPTIQSKLNTQQSMNSFSQQSYQFHQDSMNHKQLSTLQDSDDVKSGKAIFDQSIQSKRSEQPKGLVRVGCSSQIDMGKNLRTNSMTKKTSIVLTQPSQVLKSLKNGTRKQEAMLSKLFFRLDFRLKLNKLELLYKLKQLL